MRQHRLIQGDCVRHATDSMVNALLAGYDVPKVDNAAPINAKLDEPTYADRLAEKRPVRRWQRRIARNAGASNATSTVRPDSGHGGRGWIYSAYGASRNR